MYPTVPGHRRGGPCCGHIVKPDHSKAWTSLWPCCLPSAARCWSRGFSGSGNYNFSGIAHQNVRPNIDLIYCLSTTNTQIHYTWTIVLLRIIQDKNCNSNFNLVPRPISLSDLGTRQRWARGTCEKQRCASREPWCTESLQAPFGSSLSHQL